MVVKILSDSLCILFFALTSIRLEATVIDPCSLKSETEWAKDTYSRTEISERVRAIACLKSTGHELTLRKLLNDSSSPVQSAALKSLAAIHKNEISSPDLSAIDPIIRYLSTQILNERFERTPFNDQDLRNAELGRTSALCERRAVQKREYLQQLRKLSKESNSELASEAVKALGKLGSNHCGIGKEGILEITSALKRKDRRLTYESTWALSLLRFEALSALPALMESAVEEEERMRAHSVENIRLTEFYVGLSPEEPRRLILQTIGDFGNVAAKAAPILTRALSDDAVSIRKTAAISLSSIGVTREAVAPLILNLSHHDPEVRRASALALAANGDIAKPAVPALTSALSDASPHVRLAAALGLKRLAKHAYSAVAALQVCTNDPDHFARAAAKEALAEIQKAHTNK